jgi:ketosteroid isomerase-like protein
MKKTHFLLALMLVAAPIAHAQTAGTKQPPAPAGSGEANVEQALMKMERDSLAALLKKDAAGFGKFLAEDAVLTGPDGTVQTKAQLLADVKSGDLALESSELADMKVHVHGDAAIVTYATTDKGKYKAQDISGRYRWTDVFVRRAGTWQIVAGQGTPIQQPQP